MAAAAEYDALPIYLRNLDGFLLTLRNASARIDIGIPEEIAIRKLLIHLITNDSVPSSPREAVDWLSPIVSTTAREQQSFRRQYLAWADRQLKTQKRLEVIVDDSAQDRGAARVPTGRFDAKPSPAGRKAPDKERPYAPGIYLVGGAVALGVIIYAVYAGWSPTVDPGGGVTGPVGSGTGGAGEGGGAAANNDTPTGGFAAGDLLAVAPDLTRFFLAVLPLLAVWYFASRTGGNVAALTRGSAQPTQKRRMDIDADGEGELFGDDALRFSMRRLKQYRTAPTRNIDTKRTLRAALAQPDPLDSFFFRTRPSACAHVVLADRIAPNDHATTLADAFVSALQQEEIEIDSYDFRGDPAMCVARLADGTQNWLDLDEIADLHPGETLMIFGDAENLLDPINKEMGPWFAAGSGFGPIALLSSTPREEWGAAERVVQDAGIAIFPTTPGGLKAYCEWSELPERGSESEAAAQRRSRAPFPRILRTAGAGVLDENWPERDKQGDRLVNQLRSYLGPYAFDLLCAAAVFPRLHPQLTVFLGQELKDAYGRQLLSEERLSRLSRLIWMRRGHMPDWLRRRLIGLLSPEREAEIRTLLRNFDLTPHAAVELGHPFTMDLSRREDADPNAPLSDVLFVEFLERGTVGPLSVEISQSAAEDIAGAPNRRRQVIGAGVLAGLAIILFMGTFQGWGYSALAWIGSLLRCAMADQAFLSLEFWAFTVPLRLMCLAIVLIFVATPMMQVANGRFENAGIFVLRKTAWLCRGLIAAALIGLLLAAAVYADAAGERVYDAVSRVRTVWDWWIDDRTAFVDRAGKTRYDFAAEGANLIIIAMTILVGSAGLLILSHVALREEPVFDSWAWFREARLWPACAGVMFTMVGFWVLGFAGLSGGIWEFLRFMIADGNIVARIAPLTALALGAFFFRLATPTTTMRQAMTGVPVLFTAFLVILLVGIALWSAVVLEVIQPNWTLITGYGEQAMLAAHGIFGVLAVTFFLLGFRGPYPALALGLLILGVNALAMINPVLGLEVIPAVWSALYLLIVLALIALSLGVPGQSRLRLGAMIFGLILALPIALVLIVLIVVAVLEITIGTSSKLEAEIAHMAEAFNLTEADGVLRRNTLMPLLFVPAFALIVVWLIGIAHNQRLVPQQISRFKRDDARLYFALPVVAGASLVLGSGNSLLPILALSIGLGAWFGRAALVAIALYPIAYVWTVVPYLVFFSADALAGFSFPVDFLLTAFCLAGLAARKDWMQSIVSANRFSWWTCAVILFLGGISVRVADPEADLSISFETLQVLALFLTGISGASLQRPLWTIAACQIAGLACLAITGTVVTEKDAVLISLSTWLCAGLLTIPLFAGRLIRIWGQGARLPQGSWQLAARWWVVLVPVLSFVLWVLGATLTAAVTEGNAVLSVSAIALCLAFFYGFAGPAFGHGAAFAFFDRLGRQSDGDGSTVQAWAQPTPRLLFVVPAFAYVLLLFVMSLMGRLGCSFPRARHSARS